ncbi:Cytoskeleton protein RodZ [Candidatus Providencia siddallii]|uniref:Cytoskeleton protein RodZ n=1 Tax=Candidatus Providencia siddallii TaxID=1715285 RepID=A0A0M6W9C8_9GAMM|nr:Cytoskeleton protein RodZ [Candidatus Providencia siddallii]
MSIENNTELINSTTIGKKLAQAREKLGLTHELIAEKICLKITTIKEIEQDIKPSGIGPTFLRGYIRLYAREVGISENDINFFLKTDKTISFTNTFHKNESSYSINKKYKNYELLLIKFIWMIVVSLIITTGIKWLMEHHLKKNELISIINQNKLNYSFKEIELRSDKLLNPLIKILLSVGNRDLENDFDLFKIKPSKYYIKKNILINSFPSLYLNKLQELKDINTSKKSSSILILNFFGLCWLEISDINKKILFSGTKNTGDVLEFNREKYYHLNIGAPANVSVKFQGEIIDFSHYINTNRPAKINLSEHYKK